MIKYLLMIFLIVFISCNKEEPTKPEIPEGDFWQQTKPIGQQISNLIIDSQDRLYVVHGIRYLSYYDGSDWVNLNNGLLSPYIITQIQSVAINSSGHIFVSSGSGQIYRSTNNGNDWIEVSNNNIRASRLLINSSNDIFGISCCGRGGEGVYRSTDNGDTWIKQTEVLENFYPSSISINSKGYLFAESNAGIFRSTDNGNSWTQINQNWIWILSIAPNDDIFIVEGFNERTVYRSTDDGLNWIPEGKVNFSSNSWGGKQLVINSQGDLFITTGSVGVARSTDNGKTWTQINKGLKYPFTLCLAINSNGYLFAGTLYDQTKGEVFKSIKSTIE